jgi:anaerobic dimethyl sulfoxide reductase subunit A
MNAKSGDVIKYTSCSYHCYRVCILKVRIRDGVIVSCEPDDTINSGVAREDSYLPKSIIDSGMISSRPCARGYAQMQLIYDPKRVIYPMKRVGNRGEAKFERISWDEALDTIAAKLVETKQKYGPYSIYQMYSGFGRCDFPLASWFGAGVAGWDAHSQNGWIEPESWVLGTPGLVGGNPSLLQDEMNIFKSKLIVLWGINILTSMSGGAAYNLLRARESGIPIVSIESRYTNTAEVLADQWIPIRAGTDVSMMIAMANVWFKENLCDNNFVNKYVEPVGLKRWQDYVLGKEDGVDKDPRWAESICGVPAETIAEFARLYARSKPVNLNVAWSIGRQFFGENHTRAAMYLQALSGNMCIPGGTAASSTGLQFGHWTMPFPKVDWQRKSGSYEAPVVMGMWKWPRAIDLLDKLEKHIISKEEYNGLIGNAANNVIPNLKMLIFDGNNHLNSLPDINESIRAFKKVDFVVVTSQYAETPQARYADILLPQIYSAYEGRNCRSGLVQAEDLFYKGKHLTNYIMYVQKCIDPVGEVKANDWVWTQIAKRLGLAEQYNPRMVNVSDKDWDDNIEALHKEGYTKWANLKEISPFNPPSWEEFQKKPVFRWELKDPNYSFKTEIEAGQNPFQGTESGKIEFYSNLLAKGPQHLATNDHPIKGTARCYGPGNLPPMAKMSMGGKDNFFSEDTKKYPLLMSSSHSQYRVHSYLDNDPWLKDDCYRHAVWMSVPDAKLRNIKDDDLVRVFNDIGEMIIPAYVTSRIVPGTVVVHHGGWYTAGGPKTKLMPDGIDTRGACNLLIHNDDIPETIVGMFNSKGLVQVEKAEV